MADFLTHMQNPAPLSEEEQKSVAAPLEGDMGERHKAFVQQLSRMIEHGEIEPMRIESFLKKEEYERLDEKTKAQVDRSLPNIADLLRHIIDFYRSKQTPDACPQLETMIEQLWQMKERIESHGDVFTF